MPVLTYGSEKVIWREKERSRIRAVQMNNLRYLVGVRGMDSPECTDKTVVWDDEGCRRKD